MGNDKIETDKYTVYFEDCISGMKKYIPDNSIDFIITDPPYGVGKDFEKDIDLNYTIRASFLELFKKLKNNKFFTYTCPCNKIDFFIEATKSAGFKFERILFYYKKSKFTDVWIGWLLKSEAILIFSKGRPNKSNSNHKKYYHDVYEVDSPNEDSPTFIAHQSTKDIEVWRHLISVLSKEGDVVLDPFLGSGTTTYACRFLNRKCIGFEIKINYKELIEKRMKQTLLFGRVG